MKLFRLIALLLAVSAVTAGQPAFAGANDPLFVNMTADDSHRANMAIGFSKNQLEKGHPLTIFLNDKGVLVGAKANAGKYKEQQAVLAEILKKGGTVIACPMCMKHYGVKESDLLDGIKVGNPEFTGDALFRDNTKTLSW
jgi:sulfur relay (sulfurtransferase) complex TusBCD TusD component (DsrE family)